MNFSNGALKHLADENLHFLHPGQGGNTGNTPELQCKYTSKQDEFAQYLSKNDLEPMDKNMRINFMMEQKEKYSPGLL
eukprot:5770877-Ditylum_brightwellii.AAC.1